MCFRVVQSALFGFKETCGQHLKTRTVFAVESILRSYGTSELMYSACFVSVCALVTAHCLQVNV